MAPYFFGLSTDLTSRSDAAVNGQVFTDFQFTAVVAHFFAVCVCVGNHCSFFTPHTRARRRL